MGENEADMEIAAREVMDLLLRLVRLGLDPVAILAGVHSETVAASIRVAGHAQTREMLVRSARVVSADALRSAEPGELLASMPVQGRA